MANIWRFVLRRQVKLTSRIMALSYNDYLKIDQLLNLQQARSPGPEHDELLFIITHQVYELWFKQMLHEVDHLCGLFSRGDRNRALHTLKRLEKILKTLTQQIDILETLTPLEFNAFRDRLETASGFQSIQFRELEFVLGQKNQRKLVTEESQAQQAPRLQQRFQQATLWDAFLQFLHQAGHAIPDTELNRDVTQAIQPSSDTQVVLLTVYRDDPLLSEICEALVDFDEGMQEWRYRHVKMVERTIGTKFGTGGSAGAEYLRTTLFKPLWPDLWEIRANL
jgi:tryptophan 2,3-dioxygenase